MPTALFINHTDTFVTYRPTYHVVVLTDAGVVDSLARVGQQDLNRDFNYRVVTGAFSGGFRLFLQMFSDTVQQFVAVT